MIKPFFSIIITAYQAEPYIRQCLDSAVTQDYPANCFEVIAIDAKSPHDRTYAIMSEYSNRYSNIRVFRNDERKYQVENILLGVSEAKPGSVLCFVDGDDRLYNDQVLVKLASIYMDTNIWCTFGSYMHESGVPIPDGTYTRYPDEVITKRRFNEYPKQMYPHLRTARRDLVLRINEDDLKVGGKFARNAGDVFLFPPLLEMAMERYAFMQDVLYVYNDRNELSDHRVAPKEQIELAQLAKTRPPYSRLESL